MNKKKQTVKREHKFLVSRKVWFSKLQDDFLQETADLRFDGNVSMSVRWCVARAMAYEPDSAKKVKNHETK